ncbi:MAG: hypothetical protein CR972_00540 [Candidatus Moraniibacteriota bacterium]|nr:MAG: hypothetical protein CR972_00540 [Candidatus Moranbacteria bacterium]
MYPEFLNSEEYDVTYEWDVNGEKYTGKNIQFAPSGNTIVRVKAVFSQNKMTRKALRDVFGLSQSETVPEVFEQTIQIDLIESEELAKGISGLIATVSYNAPSYIIFLLKMTLAISIMLFIPSLLLGFGKE